MKGMKQKIVIRKEDLRVRPRSKIKPSKKHLSKKIYKRKPKYPIV